MIDTARTWAAWALTLFNILLWAHVLARFAFTLRYLNLGF